MRQRKWQKQKLILVKLIDGSWPSRIILKMLGIEIQFKQIPSYLYLSITFTLLWFCRNCLFLPLLVIFDFFRIMQIVFSRSTIESIEIVFFSHSQERIALDKCIRIYFFRILNRFYEKKLKFQLLLENSFSFFFTFFFTFSIFS